MAEPNRYIPRTHTSNDLFWPIRAFKRFVQRVEPEIYEQPQGGVTFTSKGIVKPVRAKSGQMQFGDIDSNDPFAIYRPGAGTPVDAGKALAHDRGFVYAAVNAKAREVMIIDWRLFAIKGDDHVEQSDHPALTLLDTVNDNMTSLEFKYLISACLDLTGNAFIYMDGVKNDTDKPKALYLMPPDKVQVLIDRTNWPERVAGYKLKRDTRDIAFKPYEVIHIRLPNPMDFFTGLSPVSAAAEFIDNDDYAMQFNRNFFKNGARPSGVLETEMIAETQIEALKIGFLNFHGGVENQNAIAALPKGVKWAPTGTAPKDMDFKNLSDTMRDRILSMFGVSKTILGTAEADTNRATAETADYVFSKRVIKPHMTLICDALNQALLPRYGDNLYLTFLDPVPEDRAARTNEMTEAVGKMPLLTVNEARDEFMGLGPVEGGDVLMSPVTMAAVGKPEGDGDPTPDADNNTTPNKVMRAKTSRTAMGERVAFRPPRSKLATIAQKRREIGDGLAKAVAEKVKNALQNPQKKSGDSEHDDAVYQATTERLTEAEQEIVKAIKDINAKQKDEVLENLSGAITKAVDKKKLFELAAYIAITAAALTPILTALFSREGKKGAEEVGKPDVNPLADPAAAAILKADIEKVSESYQETTLDLLAVKIEEGIEAGKSLAEIKDDVKDVYGYSDDVRAKMVAKTETFRATNAALKSAWQQSGVVKTIRWYTTSKDPCEFCSALNGKSIPISANFLDAGETMEANGHELTADYGAVPAPPVHPNCQCIARPGEISIE